MDSNTILIPLEILGVKDAEYQGAKYTTLTVRHADEQVLKLTGKAGYDFMKYKDKGVIFIECEIRDKKGYVGLRAIGVGEAE